MKSGPFAFVRTSTFRLALVYSVLFGLFSFLLLAYLYQATVGSLRAEADQRLDAEMRAVGPERRVDLVRGEQARVGEAGEEGAGGDPGVGEQHVDV